MNAHARMPLCTYPPLVQGHIAIGTVVWPEGTLHELANTISQHLHPSFLQGHMAIGTAVWPEGTPHECPHKHSLMHIPPAPFLDRATLPSTPPSGRRARPAARWTRWPASRSGPWASTTGECSYDFVCACLLLQPCLGSTLRQRPPHAHGPRGGFAFLLCVFAVAAWSRLACGIDPQWPMGLPRPQASLVLRDLAPHNLGFTCSAPAGSSLPLHATFCGPPWRAGLAHLPLHPRKLLNLCQRAERRWKQTQKQKGRMSWAHAGVLPRSLRPQARHWPRCWRRTQRARGAPVHQQQASAGP